jgi:hypothetical protein
MDTNGMKNYRKRVAIRLGLALLTGAVMAWGTFTQAYGKAIYGKILGSTLLLSRFTEPVDGTILALPDRNVTQISNSTITQDLRELDPNEIDAYRWLARAFSYKAHDLVTLSVTKDLRELDSDESNAYRWQALANFYETQACLPAAWRSYNRIRDGSSTRLKSLPLL